MTGDGEPNRYAGKCYRCGGRVEPGAGFLRYAAASQMPWEEMRFQRNVALLQHATCAEKYRGTDTHYRLRPDPEIQDE